MRWQRWAMVAGVAAAGCFHKDDEFVTVQYPDPDTQVRVTKNAFGLQTGYPSDLEIVDASGLADIAFVFDGATIVAVRLGAGALTAATGISGYTLQTASVFGDDLCVLSSSAGFATASAGNSSGSPVAVVEVFHPTTGANRQIVNVARTFTNGASLPDSDASTSSSFTQANVAGACYVPTSPTQGKLYVTMSNLKAFGVSAPDFHPGTVQVWAVDWSLGTPVASAPTATLTTTHYNPTHATPFTDPASGRRYVCVTCTGKYAFGGPVATPGSIDVIEVSSDLRVTNIPLGNAAPAFQDVAWRQVTNPSGVVETYGLVGSALFGSLYQVNLTQLDALRQAATLPSSYTAAVVNDVSNPIAVTTTSDFIVDVEAAAGGRYVFCTSFNLGEMRIVDFGGATPVVNASPGPFRVGSATNGISVNSLEIRPGNFEGPELFTLTGSFPGPDRVASVQTSLKVSAP